MSKGNLVLFLLFFFSYQTASAQSVFKTGVVVGLNGSQLSGDTYSGYNQPGFYAGLFSSAELSERLRLRFDVAFSQKGARHNPKPDKGDYNQYLLRLNYIDIPLGLEFDMNNYNIGINCGVGFSYLLSSYEEANYIPIITNRKFFAYELSAYLGLSYKLSDKFKLMLKASNSISPIRPHLGNSSFRLNRGQYTSLLTFSLYYTIGKS